MESYDHLSARIDRKIVEQGEDPASRRRFLRQTCSAVALMGFATGAFAFAGCDAAGRDEGLPGGVTLAGNRLTIDASQFPDLKKPDGFLWIADADVIVIHDDKVGYRAFSSVCPHEGRDVRLFDGDELRCPTHDWTFDLLGQPTGPARRPISSLPLSAQDDVLVVTLDR